MRHGGEKYNKFSYSATFGFSVPTGAYGLEQVVPDNLLALSDDVDIRTGNGEHWRVRRVPLDPKLVKGEGRMEVALSARWDAWKDVEVKSWVLPLANGKEGDWYMRIHRIVTGREIRVCDAAYSVDGRKSDGSRRRLDGWDDARGEGLQLNSGTPSTSALVRSSAGTIGIRSIPWSPNRLGGEGGGSGVPRIIQCAPNSNIVFPSTLLPAVVHKLTPRSEPYWIVSAVFAVVGHGKEDGWKEAWEERVEVPAWIEGVLKAEV